LKIVLDNTILVRAHEHAHGLGRELLASLVESKGEADILCTNNEDLFEKPIAQYVSNHGISVLDDIALMERLRT
jgi:hypothetical protein